MKDCRDSHGSQLSAAMVNQPHLPRTDNTRPKEETPEGGPANNDIANRVFKGLSCSEHFHLVFCLWDLKKATWARIWQSKKLVIVSGDIP